MKDLIPILVKILIIVIILLVIVLLLPQIKNNNTRENFTINQNNNLYPLQFVHIPKNAGTSIELIGKKHNILWGFQRMEKEGLSKSSKDYFKSKLPWVDKVTGVKYEHTDVYPWHRTPDDVLDMYPKNVKLFAVVRNPYTKIVSAYKYNQGKNSNKKGLNIWVQEHLYKYKFDDNYKHYNSNHILEQNAFTHGKRKVDYILKLENLEQDFQNLMNNYSSNNNIFKIEKGNSSNNNVSIKDLDTTSINLINDVYYKDFKLYNYTIIKK